MQMILPLRLGELFLESVGFSKGAWEKTPSGRELAASLLAD